MIVRLLILAILLGCASFARAEDNGDANQDIMDELKKNGMKVPKELWV